MTSVGMICLLSAMGDRGAVGFWLGVGFLGVSGVWWIAKKPTFELHLGGPLGQTISLASRDEQMIERVAAAVNDVLAARGESS
jgi:hypothetical protein